VVPHQTHLGNLIAHGIAHLATIVKNRLKRIQYRPELVDAFFVHWTEPRTTTAVIPAFQDL
jgi:hypothetical protein